VKNSGFEKDSNSDNIPDYWKVERGSGSYVTDEVCSGKHSIKLENNGFWIQRGIECAPGKYKLTIHVKTNDNYRFYFERWKSSQDKHYACYSPAMKGNGTWEEKSITFDYPGGETNPYIVLFVKGNGVAYFDDISLVCIKAKSGVVAVPAVSGKKTVREGNLVQNSSFEKKGPSVGGLDRPDNWQGVVIKGQKLAGEWATDRKHSGEYSAKLTVPDALWIQHHIPLVYGKTYICTINVMAKEPGTKYRFYVEAGSAAEWWCKYSPVKEAPLSWQSETIEFTVTQPLVKEVYVVLVLQSQGTIWFDDIFIEEKK